MRVLAPFALVAALGCLCGPPAVEPLPEEPSEPKPARRGRGERVGRDHPERSREEPRLGGQGRDGDGCWSADDCRRDLLCCLTVLGAVCVHECTFADAGMVVIGQVCTSDAECPDGLKCRPRVTVRGEEMHTCE